MNGFKRELLDDLPPYLLEAKKETRGRKRADDPAKRKYGIAEAKKMLGFVNQDDRDTWRNVGVILGREFARSDEAWNVYVEWSAAWGGTKGRNHDGIMREAFYEISQDRSSGKELSMGTIVHLAKKGGWAPQGGEVPIGNFIFYGPGNNFIYRPTVSYWIAGAVDAAVAPINENGTILRPSEWLKANQLATSMTCDPAIDEDYLRGFDCRNGEVVEIAGAAMFNTYRRPSIELGDARLAQPFIAHVRRVFNKAGDADQFLDYMAHRVQCPEEKPRFALLIAGDQGVGKDTAIEFCIPAIGAWNVAPIEPSAFETQFNEYAASALVRINEAANLHEMSKWAFNERTKVLIAGSPDVCHINPKYGQKFFVRMYCGVIVTTNNLAAGIYIPADDRRYDVIECATKIEMGLMDDEQVKDYFVGLWNWFNNDGGVGHVAAYLHARDVSKFSASNGQRKTDAHKSVVANGMTGDSWLIDILDELEYPDMIRADRITAKAVENGENAANIKSKMGSALGRAGYITYRNPDAKDGRWRFNLHGIKKATTVFIKPGAEINLGKLNVDYF